MKELYEKVAKDSALQEKFNSIMKDSEKMGEEAAGEKLTAFAKEAGYEISLDEMKAFFTELSGKDKGELSDTELDMVAGGKSVEGIVHIASSVITVGIGCGFISVLHEGYHAINSINSDCKDSFE
jgi:predicted ribosomally synthesized peptide with nif11-like leader